MNELITAIRRYLGDRDPGQTGGDLADVWAAIERVEAAMAAERRVYGEMPGGNLPPFPDDLHTFRERAAYQRGVYDARMLQHEEAAVAEPVAVVGDTFSLLYSSSDSMAEIAKRHGLKVGSKLYAAPLGLRQVHCTAEVTRAMVEDVKRAMEAGLMPLVAGASSTPICGNCGGLFKDEPQCKLHPPVVASQPPSPNASTA